jgi:tetratricopeptide (TPR) repeat protein
MGCIYRRAGRFDDAIDCHDKALELRTKVLGGDHISLSHDLIAIGDIHYCQRQFDNSLAAFSECMSLNHLNLVDSSSTGIDLGLLASISYKMGEACFHLEDRSNATDCYEDAVDIARSAIPTAGDDIAMEQAQCNRITELLTKCLYNLAAIHRAEGSICKAIACAEEAIQLGLLEQSSTLMRNQSACSILSFMMLLYQDKGDNAKVQMYSQRITELEINDDMEEGCASWRKKRFKLSCARAA